MAVYEKLYKLRKKSGLSQEQLAEKLGVSRQAISKWEQGVSMPEGDKLVAISNFFGVTLDYLLKDEEREDTPLTDSEAPTPAKQTQWVLGLVACIGGAICMIIWGLLSILSPDASDKIGASSMIAIDGNGILLIVCIVAIVVGAVLLLKASKTK